METTLNTLITFTFFAPMAALVAIDLLTHRTTGPAARLPSLRKPTWMPLPPATAAAVANESRYLEAA
jgi:hypothetical protein